MRFPKLPKIGLKRHQSKRLKNDLPSRRFSELGDGKGRGAMHYQPKRGPKLVDSKEFQKRRKRLGRKQALRSTVTQIGGQMPAMPETNIGIRFVWVVPMVVIILLFGFGYFLHENSVFVVQKVEIVGNEEISDLQIISTLGQLEGQSLIEISGADLEDRLEQEFPYIRTAYVDKLLPGQVRVTLVERFPEFVYSNLSGAYLIDRDAVVVEVLGVEQQSELTDTERLIVEGLGDFDADYVLTEYISQIEDDEELENLDWSKVPNKEKREVLEQMKQSIQTEVNELRKEKTEFVRRAGFDRLPAAFGYDAKLYEVGEQFNSKQMTYTQGVTNYLKGENIAFVRLIWLSDFTMEAIVSSQLRILFTSTRDLENQIASLQTLRESININKVRLIDVRSEIVSTR